MHLSNRALLATFVTLPLLACDPVDRADPAERQADGGAASAAPAPAHHHEGGGQCGGQCGEGPPAADEERLVEPTTVGAPISDSVELVEASAIVADPQSFEGRTVRVTGRVKGYCHHRRAWYAIDVPGGNPPYLQIVTAPGFQVPPGIMNARATAVGTIEISQVPGSRRAHYEREHALGSGDSEPGRATRAILRATGARFEPPAS